MNNTLTVANEVINDTIDRILKIKFNKFSKEITCDNFQSILIFLPDMRSIMFIKKKLLSLFKEFIERQLLKIFELNSTLEVNLFNNSHLINYKLLSFLESSQLK